MKRLQLHFPFGCDIRDAAHKAFDVLQDGDADIVRFSWTTGTLYFHIDRERKENWPDEPESKREAALSMTLKMANALIEKQDAALARMSNVLETTTGELNQCKNMLDVAERGAILPTADNVMAIIRNMSEAEVNRLGEMIVKYACEQLKYPHPPGT